MKLTTIPFILISTLLFIRPIHDPDLWWHLGVGQYIWQTKSIPYTDIFSFTAPEYPYVYHSWLSELILYLIHKFSGLWGITLFYALIGSLSLHFLKKTTQLLLPTTNYLLPVTYYLFLTIPFIIYLTNLRVQLISFLFLTILLYLLVSQFFSLSRRKPASLRGSSVIKSRQLLIPILFLFWTNLHGGFILGLLLLTTFILTSKLQLITIYYYLLLFV